jgi:hypothetical protein
MFIIKHNDKIVEVKDTYEEARSRTRKIIRTHLDKLNFTYRADDVAGVVHRNPSINMYGYSIEAI